MLGSSYLEQELAQFTQPSACSPGGLTTRAQQEADSHPTPAPACLFSVSLAGGPHHLCAPPARGKQQSGEERLSALRPPRPSTLSSRTSKARCWWPQVHRRVGASLWVEPAARGCFPRLLRGREGRGNAGRGTQIRTWRWPALFGGGWSSFRGSPVLKTSQQFPTLPALQRAVPNSFEILSLLFFPSFFCFPAASLTSMGHSALKGGFWLQRYLGQKPALLVPLPLLRVENL